MRAFAEPVNSDSLPGVDLGHVAPNGRSIHGAGAFCDDRACITSAVAKLPNVPALQIERSRALPQPQAQARRNPDLVPRHSSNRRQGSRTELNLSRLGHVVPSFARYRLEQVAIPLYTYRTLLCMPLRYILLRASCRIKAPGSAGEQACF